MPWRATNSEGFASPAALAVDIVVLSVSGDALMVLTRPVDGGQSLPGALVREGEDPRAAATRVLGEKAGLTGLYLEQLGAFAAPNRDPRGWIPSIAHLALVPPATVIGDPQAVWSPVHGEHRWLFDHADMVRSAIDRVEGKLWWSNVAVGILPGAFSMSDARAVYGAIAGTVHDAATFARDLKATGLIEPTGQERREGRGRPAALYRFAKSDPVWGTGRRKRVARA